MFRRTQISPSDLSAVRAIVSRYYPRTAALERVASYNNLVVRLKQPDGHDKMLKLAFTAPRTAAMAREPQVMALLRQNGVPVPLVEIEDLAGKLVGRPFFTMRSEGLHVIEQLFLPAAVRELWERLDMLDVVADVDATDVLAGIDVDSSWWVLDRSLSQYFNAPGFATTYVKWFGKPDETAKNFYRWNALPQ